MSKPPTRIPDAELPLKGLFALQARLLAFTTLLPLAAWIIPWPGNSGRLVRQPAENLALVPTRRF